VSLRVGVQVYVPGRAAGGRGRKVAGQSEAAAGGVTRHAGMGVVVREVHEAVRSCIEDGIEYE
jgi:hypothetical protein